MPWDLADKWRDEDHWPPRGTRESKRDPFLGKCIHGIEGARMEKGHLYSPECDECLYTMDQPSDT